MKIGNREFKHGIFLAPLAGVSDRSFRALCALHGAELTYTEMISAKAVHYGDKKTELLADSGGASKDTAIQIFGSEPDIMAEAARFLCEKFSPVLIDINMGCPMKKIVTNGEGAALMKDPALCEKIVKAVRKAVKTPLTVKMRTGWDEGSKNAPYIAQLCASAGADAIAVHGRTREQLYSPPVDYETIEAVGKSIFVPLIANGGIYTPADAERMFSTGCEAIMVAQGAMGNPFIFEELTAHFENREYTPPSEKEKLSEAVRHIEMIISDKGEYTGVREGRHHLAWYTKGMRGASAVRTKINSACTAKELKEIIDGFSKSLCDTE